MTKSADGNASEKDSFALTVDCGTPNSPHSHYVTIGHAWGVRGVGPPTNVRLQYTCPVSGATRIMTFRPPGGAARPFEIRQIS
jgi:hypothetical protein